LTQVKLSTLHGQRRRSPPVTRSPVDPLCSKTHPSTSRPPTPQKLLAEGRFLKVAMAAEKFNAPFAADVLRTIAEAAAGADLVVTAAMTQTASMSVAEKLGVPWVSAELRAGGGVG
jgi:hypothetical protein